jgi:hypothetical protein
MQKNMEMVSDDMFIQTLQRNGGFKFTSVRRNNSIKELRMFPPPSRVLGKSSDMVASPPPYDGINTVISIQIGFIIIACVALTMLVLLILKKC